MSYSFTRIASLVLAFGFFISCSISKTHINHKSASQDLSETQLEQKIGRINSQISSGGRSKTLLYQKGLYLTKLAQKKEPASRRSALYIDARNALNSVIHPGGDATQEEQDNVRELLSVSWSNEHNKGVQIMQKDSTLDRGDYSHAAAHFKNATLIIPDSAISYQKGASAFYQSQQPKKAIELLEKARERVDKMPATAVEQLAFLYLETDQPADAIKVYEEAESFSHKNMNVLHGLSNAYINAGMHEQSTAILQKLVERKPDNVAYRQSLATELYYLGIKNLDSLMAQKALSSSEFETADSILSRAEGHFKELVTMNKDDREIKQRLAQFYHNRASKYQKLLPLAGDDQKAQIKSAIKSFLSSAVPLFEQLVEQYPGEKVFWKNLYQAYSYLGMSEEARNAKSNI